MRKVSIGKLAVYGRSNGQKPPFTVLDSVNKQFDILVNNDLAL